jgi:putative redox protein
MTSRPPNRVTLRWLREQRFESLSERGGKLELDGSSSDLQSPPEALMSSLAGCAAIDIVEILKKRRTPPASLRCEVVGTRVDGTPRRFIHILLEFHVEGDGIEQEHAERAIELSVSKYCSVRDSLAKDLEIEWTLFLNGVATGTRHRG